MKKIRLTESQLDMISKETSMDESWLGDTLSMMDPRVMATNIRDTAAWIKRFSRKATPLKAGEATITASQAQGLADQIYDGITVLTGTDEDKVASALGQLQNWHDCQLLAAEYYRSYKSILLKDLLGDFQGNEFERYIMRPLRRAWQASKDQGHFGDLEGGSNDETEKAILEKFPCIKDEPGYAFKRSNDGVLYFASTANEGITDYGIKPDGTLFYYKDSKWNSAGSAACTSAEYQDIAEGLSYGSLSTGSSTPAAGGETQGTVTQGTANQGSEAPKPTTTTKLMTGDDVTEIQKMLVAKGYGSHLGTSGPNKDGVDGKLGKGTLSAIKAFMLGTDKPITNLEPKKPSIPSVEPKADLQPNAQLAEAVQNFKRFIK